MRSRLGKQPLVDALLFQVLLLLIENGFRVDIELRFLMHPPIQ